jgi:hypothetical protein
MATEYIRLSQKVAINQMIKKTLIALAIAAAAFYSYPCIGWVIATYDYKFGTPEYYFYGYIESDKAKFLKEKLKERKIIAKIMGCSVGGPQYEFNIVYNATVESSLPSDYFKNLRKEFQNISIEN